MKWKSIFLLQVISILLLTASALTFAGQVYGAAKGVVAEILLERALRAHFGDGERHPPWGWADMYPVALIELPDRSIRRIVLTGATGESMAFGVGWLDGTAPPNAHGNCVLAGHRDRAFAFLEDLRPGDALRLTSRSITREWVVRGASITNSGDAGVVQPSADDRLTLVTCYPFDRLTPSELRLIILCDPAGERQTETAF